MEITQIFSFIILILSVVLHELAHGYMALYLGDPTAKYAGRLTLNPIKHIDPIGSVLVPIITSFAGITFGWAKPVPYNPYNLRNQKWGEAMVAAAGPLTNILIAVVFGLIIRFGLIDFIGNQSLAVFFGAIVVINIVLALFNLIPIPPLDGSKIFFSFLPLSANKVAEFMQRYWLIFIFIFIYFLWQFLTPIIYIIFSFLTGLG